MIKNLSNQNLNYAIAVILIQKALLGDIKAIQIIINRTEGKPLKIKKIETSTKVNLIIEK